MTRQRGLTVVLGVSALALAACGSSSKSASSSTGASTAAASTAASSAAASDPALAAAITATAADLKGAYRPVDPTSRPAAKNKSIVIISQGLASISSSVPTEDAKEAAEAAGWKVSVYDGKLDASTYPGLVRQAIAAHADGIILQTIDCDAVEQPLKEAVAAGIKVVGIYDFDCNNPLAGNSQPLLSNELNYGSDYAGLSTKYGADEANYIIAKSNNTAKVLSIDLPGSVVLHYTTEVGFTNAIKNSGGSQIVDTLDIGRSDLVGSALAGKIQAELIKHPDINWIRAPFSTITQIGIVPALAAAGKTGKIDVMSDGGTESDYDFLRAGKITAVQTIPNDWVAWAAVDALNSSFLGQKPPDSGVGYAMIDATHNLPAAGQIYEPPVDFKSAFKKAWGVS